MKNKKGFTLVELLGVLVVLSVILMIAYPLITSYVRNTKEKAYEVQMELMLTSLRDHANEHKEWLPQNDGDYITLTLGQLKSVGIIKNSVINPLDGKEIEDSMEFKITKNGTRYQYEIIENTIETREDKAKSPSIELSDSPLLYLPLNSEYVEPGVKGYDYDGVEIAVTIDNKVDMTKDGIYLVKYTAIAGNGITTYAYRTVVVGNGGFSKNYKIGDTVFFDPEENRICSDYIEKNSNPEVVSGCLKWYVYKIEEDGYKLILDHNTTQNEREDREAVLTSDTATWDVSASLLEVEDILPLIDFYNNGSYSNTEDFYITYSEELDAAHSEIMDKIPNTSFAFYGYFVVGKDVETQKTVKKEMRDNYSEFLVPLFMYDDLITGCDNTGYCDSYGYWVKDFESALISLNGELTSNYGPPPIGIRPTIKIAK